MVLNLCAIVFTIKILETHGVMEGKIVGGEYVSIRSAPHSVFVYIEGPDDVGDWCCGGSVLNQQLLLTAAHCLDNLQNGGHADAIAGNANTEEAVIVRQVRRFMQHADYSRVDGHCDIALMVVKPKLPLAWNIQRVIIRPTFPNFVMGKVSGWGITSAVGDEVSIKLKSVSQKTVDISVCAKYHKYGMKPGMMCGSSGHSSDYPASGDSGSALITAEHQQVGLVSIGFRRKTDVVIYTNVSYFYHWIYKKTKLLYCIQNKKCPVCRNHKLNSMEAVLF